MPLEAINMASAHEKSVPRKGHPATMHLWWARRPLATCRATLFGQMVDDPSSVPEEFPTKESQDTERQRLFRIIENLVRWENSTNEAVLYAARLEIARSVARAADVPFPTTPEAVRSVLDEHAPPVLDPFCGGGSISLEAQRLGLRAIGSDLNPVAVLITKALTEVPFGFAEQPPTNPRDAARMGGAAAWRGATGLAADVRFYGQWMREEAWARVGHMYPKVKLPAIMGGGEATAVAWLWARTVKCPNPACGAQMPLVRSFFLSSKKGREAWADPVVKRLQSRPAVQFEIRTGRGAPEGTVSRRGALCIACCGAVPLDYLRSEGRAGRMARQLMAVVAEGARGRVYVAPSAEQERPAELATANQVPDTDLPTQALGFRVQLYGMTRHRDLFTPRQLAALTTFSDLVAEMHEGLTADGGDAARADAVATYLAFALDKLADWSSTICSWIPGIEGIRDTFARQAIPMVWDYAECNPFSVSAGNFLNHVEWVAAGVDALPASAAAVAESRDATRLDSTRTACIVSTDPPYFDNIGYADLSDFFYVWLRRTLRTIYPGLFATVLTPKQGELVASPGRFPGGAREAKAFFESGLEEALVQARHGASALYPVAIYYGYKQAEDSSDGSGYASTGWETMLEAIQRSGFQLLGTWPVRSERSGRPRDTGSNALASSILLICRPRDAESAGLATRKEFTSALHDELASALAVLRSGDIAPVDLAQASIGPGMAIFSRYSRVVETNGDPMTVRSALALINQELAAILSEQEGEVDTDTRFCISWFEEYGLAPAEYGRAETLAKAKNTSVEGLNHAGVLEARAGRVRLLRRDEMGTKWDPVGDRRLTDWECAQHLILALELGSETDAAALARRMGMDKAQTAHDLAYLLFSIADRKGWAEEALAYNTLVTSWPEVQKRMADGQQGMLV